MKFLKILTLALITPVFISACGNGSNDQKNDVVGSQPIPPPTEVTLQYNFTENGCTAHQKVTGKSHEEAKRKLCEAAADSARNNFCAPMIRAMFLRSNCGSTVEVAPRAAEEVLTTEEFAMLDYKLKNTEYKASWFSNYATEIEGIARRMASCGLDARGVKCLDNIDQFTRARLFKDRDGMAMRFSHFPTGQNLQLRFKGDNVVILVDVGGSFQERAGLEAVKNIRVPELPYDEIELYHRSERALSIAKAAADASGGTMCSACAEYYNVKLDFVRAINYLARKIANAKTEVYQEAIIDLALDRGIAPSQLSLLAEMLNFYKAHGPLAKTLVLYKYPRRVDLREAVKAYATSRNPKHGVLATYALMNSYSEVEH